MHRLIVATSGRNPFEIAFLVASLMCGTALLASGVRPESVSATMPPPLELAWQIGLIFAGASGLIGLYWPGQLSTRLAIELGSMLVLGTNTLMYSIAIMGYAGSRAIASAILICAISVASARRAWQVFFVLRLLRRGVTIGNVGAMSVIVDSADRP